MSSDPLPAPAIVSSGVSSGTSGDRQQPDPASFSCTQSYDRDGKERKAALRRLRVRVRAIEAGMERQKTLPLGLEILDRHLPGGGLPLGGLHEIEGERVEWDDGAATGFCLAVLVRLLASGKRGAVLWAARWRDLYAPGLASFGLDPGRLILVRATAETDVLWAMEEGLRCADLAAVVGEADTLDRAASRRLQLAAEEGGRPAFVLRRGLRPMRHAGGGPTSLPSGALSRWRIAPQPSVRVVCPVGQALNGAAVVRLPGQARWSVELLRCRGTGPGQWDLEWDHATGGFALAAELRDRPLASAAECFGARRAS